MQKHPGQTADILANAADWAYNSDQPLLFKQMFKLYQNNPEDKGVAAALYRARRSLNRGGERSYKKRQETIDERRQAKGKGLDELRKENKDGKVLESQEKLRKS